MDVPIVLFVKRQFDMGQLVSTPGALDALEKAEELPTPYLERHLSCDWGYLDPEDKKANDQAVKAGDRILSAYRLKTGTKLWLITEADRSATTILLPDEY